MTGIRTLDKTITSANAVILAKAPGVVDSFVRLEGFAMDNIFAFEDVTIAETQMGADGGLSGGAVMSKVTVNTQMQANSPTIGFFKAIMDYWMTNKEIPQVVINVELPSVGLRTALTGFVVSGTPFPSAKKLLEPVNMKIEGTITPPEKI